MVIKITMTLWNGCQNPNNNLPENYFKLEFAQIERLFLNTFPIGASGIPS